MSHQILFIGFVVCCLTCFFNTLQAQEVIEEDPVGVPVETTKGGSVEVTEGVPVETTKGGSVEVTEGVPVEVTDEDMEESIENEIQEEPPPKQLSQKRSIYGRYDDFDKTPFKVESRLSNTILIPRKDFKDRIKDSFEKY